MVLSVTTMERLSTFCLSTGSVASLHSSGMTEIVSPSGVMGTVAAIVMAFCPDFGKISAQPVSSGSRQSKYTIHRIRIRFILAWPPGNIIYRKLYHSSIEIARKPANILEFLIHSLPARKQGVCIGEVAAFTQCIGHKAILFYSLTIAFISSWSEKHLSTRRL